VQLGGCPPGPPLEAFNPTQGGRTKDCIVWSKAGTVTLLGVSALIGQHTACGWCAGVALISRIYTTEKGYHRRTLAFLPSGSSAGNAPILTPLRFKHWAAKIPSSLPIDECTLPAVYYLLASKRPNCQWGFVYLKDRSQTRSQGLRQEAVY